MEYLLIVAYYQSYEEWTENHVKLWMEACNIDIYYDTFASHRIKGSDLKFLNSEKLQVSTWMYMHMYVYTRIMRTRTYTHAHAHMDYTIAIV